MSLLASAEPLKATARGRYLYAIVDGSSNGRAFDYLGLDGSTVYTIGDDAVAAIVSDLPNQRDYQNTYQSYATSTTGGVNGGDQADTSIYALGLTGISGWGGCGSPPVCGPLVYTTLMRWGNYDVVNAATQWNTTEASPAAVAYVNANFTSSYFSDARENAAHITVLRLHALLVDFWKGMASCWTRCFIGQCRRLRQRHLSRSTGDCRKPMRNRCQSYGFLGKPCNFDPGAGLLSQNDGRTAGWIGKRTQFRC